MRIGPPPAVKVNDAITGAIGERRYFIRRQPTREPVVRPKIFSLATGRRSAQQLENSAQSGADPVKPSGLIAFQVGKTEKHWRLRRDGVGGAE